MTESPARLDPDRFFNRTSPGAHEWWYFDAISDDGRDAIVIVWYAGLPFDPSYGVATLRHLRNPKKYPQPCALDHSAIGFSWYRDGKPFAYALNGHKAHQFRHQARPFLVEVATSRVERDSNGYSLTIATPGVDGRPIHADFRFTPSPSTEPLERDLGRPDAPHNWILAASHCRVVGHLNSGKEMKEFAGVGYHDHNAGVEDLSLAMKRWEWGRVHHGDSTHVYYRSEPHQEEPQSLWIVCRDGRPELIHDSTEFLQEDARRTVFGIRHNHSIEVRDETSGLIRKNRTCVDDGPFYLRWLADFEIDDSSGKRISGLVGIAELLDTRNLHKPWFNWMIPYRLKWPRS